MASQHTQTYDLNQWQATDPVIREDFNADNRKVDAALLSLARQLNLKASGEEVTALTTQLATLPKLEMGRYNGNGKAGSAFANTLHFSGEPAVVFIAASRSNAIHPCVTFIHGQSTASGMSDHGMTLSWSGNDVTWYANGDNPVGAEQLNATYTTYYYAALCT